MSQRTRLPQNLLTSPSEDGSGASWSKNVGVAAVVSVDVLPPIAGMTVTKVTYDGSGAAGTYRWYEGAGTFVRAGDTVVESIWLRTLAGVASVRLGNNQDLGATIVVDSTWRRYELASNLWNNPAAVNQFLLYSPAADNAAFTIYATGVQRELGVAAAGDYVQVAAAASPVNATTAPCRRRLAASRLRLPQNLIVRSNDVNNWASKINVTAALNAIGPDSVLNTASTVTDSLDGAPASHHADQSVAGFSVSTVQVGSIWCFSQVAKAGTKSKIALAPAGATYQVTYDLAAGAVGQSLNAIPIATGIIPMGSGWYRCWLTMRPTAAEISSINGGNRVYIIDAIGALTYQGAGTGTVILGDCQLEQSNGPGDIARTVAAQVNPTIAPAQRRTVS